MKSNRRLNLLLGVAGLCLTAGLLRGADFGGSFTLPREMHWGATVLPAGDYTLSVDHATPNGIVTVRQGNKNVAMVLPQGVDTTGVAGGSSLLVVRDRIRSLHLAPAGLTYHYAVPKNERQRVLAGMPRPAGVTVAIAAK